jgi:hypothetical protein
MGPLLCFIIDNIRAAQTAAFSDTKRFKFDNNPKCAHIRAFEPHETGFLDLGLGLRLLCFPRFGTTILPPEQAAQQIARL